MPKITPPMQNIEAAARPTAHQASRFTGVNMDFN